MELKSSQINRAYFRTAFLIIRVIIAGCFYNLNVLNNLRLGLHSIKWSKDHYGESPIASKSVNVL